MSDDDVINASHSASAGYLSCASFLHGRTLERQSPDSRNLLKVSLTNGDRVSYDAPLLGAKKVVHDEIPQCCILICQYKHICKC